MSTNPTQPEALQARLVALHNTLLNLDDNGDLPDAITDSMLDAVHEAALSTPTPPVSGDFPAEITNPEAWPERYADGFNDALRIVIQCGFGTKAAPTTPSVSGLELRLRDTAQMRTQFPDWLLKEMEEIGRASCRERVL